MTTTLCTNRPQTIIIPIRNNSCLIIMRYVVSNEGSFEYMGVYEEDMALYVH